MTYYAIMCHINSAGENYIMGNLSIGEETPLKGNCIVGQSGGPSSVINASAYGVIRTAIDDPNIEKVYAARYGIKGILNDDLIDMNDEDWNEIELLTTTPSSAFGSCRYKMAHAEDDETDFIRILDTFKKYDIRYFFYIGGNDSMDTCDKINRYMIASGYECRVMGVPKTIDNDLYGTDHCPGYGSAAKYVASTFMEIYQDATVYDTGMITVVEVMGRNAGWLTAAAALGSQEGCGADYIYLPEVAFDVNTFLDTVEERFETDKNVIIAVSEGLRDSKGVYISEYGTDLSENKDAFGHAQMGGLALTLANMIKARMGKVKVRDIEFSLLQRCAAHIASKTDMDEAIMVGKKAVECALNGETGAMISIIRENNDPYTITTKTIPLAKVANYEQKVPLEWINEEGNNVTEKFIDYAMPLIQGETPSVIENGLPRFTRLKKMSLHNR